jgi:hypothetical protein
MLKINVDFRHGYQVHTKSTFKSNVDLKYVLENVDLLYLLEKLWVFPMAFLL